MKKLLFIIGATGTGKTTLAKQLMPKQKKALLIDEFFYKDYGAIKKAFEEYDHVIACVQPLSGNSSLMKHILTTHIKEEGIHCNVEFRFCKRKGFKTRG